MDNMSFALTTEQVRAQTKTVTRRQGWTDAQPGDIVQPVVKRRGIPKGGHVEKIGCPIRFLSVDREPITEVHLRPHEVEREGFPDWTPDQFITFYCKENHVQPGYLCTRIEFAYTVPKEAAP